MDLLDRYLKSVRDCLPDAQRDDIINELSENLRSQIEDRETEFARPLTESEVEAILKQHGHPLLVAGRYRQDHRTVAFGRQFIGPVLFPFYAKVLTFNLGITSAILIVIFTVLFATGQPITLGEVFPKFLYQLLIQFGVVTLIFTLADMHLAKFPDRWDLRTMRPIWHPAFAVPSGSGSVGQKDPSRVSRFNSISELVGLAVGLVWLKVARQSPFMIFGPAAAFLKPASVWHQLYLPVVVLLLAGMLQAVINLARPDWVRVRSAFRVGRDLVWLGICLFLLRATNWVDLVSLPGTPAEGYRRTVAILNQSAYYLLWATAIGSAIALFLHILRLARGPRPPGAGGVAGRKDSSLV